MEVMEKQEVVSGLLSEVSHAWQAQSLVMSIREVV